MSPQVFRRPAGRIGLQITGVSGTVSHGSSVTILGSGFGHKPTAAPFRYDDFQNITVGNSVAANGWDVDGTAPVASTTRLRSGTPFDRNCRCTWTTNDASSFNSWDDATWNRVFFDAWMYFECLADPQPQNIKPFRFHQDSAGSPNHYINFYGPSSGDSIAMGRDGVTGGPTYSGWFGTNPENGIGAGNDVAASVFYDHWCHLQVLAHVGTPGQQNGTWIIKLNEAPRYYRPGNVYVLQEGYTGWPELFFGNYVRSDTHGTCYAHWECAYLDSSWARVELGDNAVYSACTHREIQVPTAWTDGSVTVTINRGSFAAGPAFLFVLDGNNRATDGYGVTVSV